MTSSAIVNRYASALADVVTSPTSAVQPHVVLEQLRTFDEMTREAPQLNLVFSSPSVSQARKRAVIERLTQGLDLSRLVRNFLFVLSDKRRLSALHEIIDAFDQEVDRRLGYIRADVSAAGQLDHGQLEQITARLASVSGKKIRLRFQVDPNLIGGVVARMGAKVYDGSVRGRLESLSKKLSVY